MSTKNKKAEQYSAQILTHLLEMFTDAECRNTIPLKELQDSDNLKCYLHSLTVVSTMLYNRLTGDEKNWIEFNHLANSLCVEFMIDANNKN